MAPPAYASRVLGLQVSAMAPGLTWFGFVLSMAHDLCVLFLDT